MRYLHLRWLQIRCQKLEKPMANWSQMPLAMVLQPLALVHSASFQNRLPQRVAKPASALRPSFPEICKSSYCIRRRAAQASFVSNDFMVDKVTRGAHSAGGEVQRSRHTSFSDLRIRRHYARNATMMEMMSFLS